MKWGKLAPRGIYKLTVALTAGAESSAADTRDDNGFDAFDAGLVTVNCGATHVWSANAHVAYGRWNGKG